MTELAIPGFPVPIESVVVGVTLREARSLLVEAGERFKSGKGSLGSLRLVESVYLLVNETAFHANVLVGSEGGIRSADVMRIEIPRHGQPRLLEVVRNAEDPVTDL